MSDLPTVMPSEEPNKRPGVPPDISKLPKRGKGIKKTYERTKAASEVIADEVMREADEVVGFNVISRKVKADMREAAKAMTIQEARYMVDSYYQMQQNRIRENNRIKSMEVEPTGALKWLSGLCGGAEDTIAGVLGTYAERFPAGRWAMDQYGVGPIIAAGLLAHIDINKCPYASHIHSYAGLIKDLKWYKTKEDKELIKAMINEVVGKKGEPTYEHVCMIGAKIKRKPVNLMGLLEQRSIPNKKNLIAMVKGKEEKKAAHEAWFSYVDPMDRLTAIADIADMTPEEMHKELKQRSKLTRKSLSAILAMRPWNAELKSLLCYKLAGSFIKLKGKEKCFYGRLYSEYKAMEAEANERGEFAELAAKKLKTVGEDTDAYEAFEKGKLPKGYLENRARRYVAKRFVEHYFVVLYETTYKKKAPQPYVIEHLGHKKYVPPPFYNSPYGK